jgi:Zn-dependent peptidase ImmA (M78 family)/transcriptional regulator with XRE-family HTH domain
MLLLARKKRRKTQVELAQESGVPQAAISRIENGIKDALSSEEIQRIAHILGMPISFFYEQEPLYRRPISLHGAAFRKKASVSVKDADAVVSTANHYILQLRKLIDAVDLEPEFELLQFEVVSNRDSAGDHARAVNSAAEAARKVRASWQLEDGPLLSLTRFVEATGVIIIHADFGPGDIDGLTLRPAGMRPVIFLNANRPADRMRFSLAHEFGHAVLHPYPYENMEKEANEFAAELLMPEQAIRSDLRRRLSIPALGQLKLKWHVAMSALIYRAKTVGAIQDEEATSLWKKMAACGYRTQEPPEFSIARETTKLGNELVRLHLEDLGYSIPELATALATSPEEFAQMFGLHFQAQPTVARPKLRLVSSSD